MPFVAPGKLDQVVMNAAAVALDEDEVRRISHGADPFEVVVTLVSNDDDRIQSPRNHTCGQ